ncbi:hypothetical protein ANCCEY_13324 [Ancylostoma ceylanicum]|uniref:TIL domain-containing protein n=1 Tax=Ancylostoma ceylanicum TaxID=53326 RepID=A0A0D6LIY0_9BILA|nr:hypothetical protein ANCCEY_13324 [Ancylostoma ceylanicum]
MKNYQLNYQLKVPPSDRKMKSRHFCWSLDRTYWSLTQVCTEQCILNVCQCKQGFFRNSAGNCVDSCYGEPCGDNEERLNSSSICEPTCDDRNPIPVKLSNALLAPFASRMKSSANVLRVLHHRLDVCESRLIPEGDEEDGNTFKFATPYFLWFYRNL